MKRTGINQRETKEGVLAARPFPRLALGHSPSSQFRLALPLQLWEATAPLPQLGWTKDLLGSSGWLASSCHTRSSWFHRGGETAFPCAGKRCFEKLAAGVGIREAGEGYHQVTMATVSLASPSPNPASPHQLVCSRGDRD